jgi:DNA-binding response OmpR family regulator
MSLDQEQLTMLQRRQPKWICFGTLAQMEPGPRALTRNILRDNPASGRFYDVNLRPHCWTPDLVETLMHEATAAKLNEDEAAALAGLFDWPLGSLRQFSELLARIQALIRRSTQSAEPTRLTAGSLTLDLLTREVQRAGERIELQPREFALLEYLMRHPNRVVTKTMLLGHIFDYSFDPQTNVVDVLVHRVRGKADPEKTMIQTIRGVGYVLRPD